jgi:hypothetical protein
VNARLQTCKWAGLQATIGKTDQICYNVNISTGTFGQYVDQMLPRGKVMTETITARYEGGTLVPLEDIDLEEL